MKNNSFKEAWITHIKKGLVITSDNNTKWEAGFTNGEVCFFNKAGDEIDVMVYPQGGPIMVMALYPAKVGYVGKESNVQTILLPDLDNNDINPWLSNSDFLSEMLGNFDTYINSIKL